MTAPFLSLAQIRNRLTLTARHALRNPARQKDRCPVCGAPAADAEVQQRSTATQPTEPDRDERQQAQ
ncbi:hypothetical protein GCM10011608_45350 [Micromonospora sonchi]|uniref:Uncharacterized protein n=1 Tax=Micromonospora sonchi TaxID=1763543 RepID=A0A917X293_9ACTN|nr:hypothetical protein [Micromonospora sonchi]GGM55442.1 hypothetical protein GCM10011608_45350 [Micromonospora sonchi]